MTSRISTPGPLRRLRLAGILALVPLSAWAQANQSPGNSGNAARSDLAANAAQPGNGANDKKSPNAREQELRKDLDDAKGLAKGNNIAAAELALTKSNSFQKNTADWHFETTQKLLQAANDLSKEGKGSVAAVRGLAVQALQRLNDAAAATKDNGLKAKAKSDSAFIHDRYMGDPTAAIASYKAALQLAPADKNIKEALERLEKADANLRAKIRAKSK